MKCKHKDAFPNEYVFPETDLTKALEDLHKQAPVIIEHQTMICQNRYDELIAKEEKLRLLEKAIKTLNGSYCPEIKMLQEMI